MSKRSVLVLSFLAVGCDGHPEPVAGVPHELTRTALPRVDGNPLPGIGATLSEKVNLTSGTGGDLCVDCSFTSGLDPDTSKTLIDTKLTSWSPPLLPSTGVGASYQAMATRAQGIIDGTDPAATGADNIHSTLDQIHDLFELIPGAQVEPVSFTQHQWLRSFKPVYGRHLRSTFNLNLSNPGSKIYADPKLLGELTDRGARSYCAMRNAAVASPKGSMATLKHDLADILFWKIGVTNADVTMLPVDDKKNRDLTNAGSQAFYIPLAIGSEVAPLTGPLVPGFGEFSHPLVWLTGDAEVEDWEGINSKKGNVYRNIEHYDVWSGTSYSGSVSFDNLLLFDLGFFQVNLGGAINVLAGALQDDEAASKDAAILANEQIPIPWMPNRNPAGLYDTFGLNTIYKDGNWPAPRQTSFWVSAVNQNNSYSLRLPGTGVFDDAIGLAYNCSTEIGAPLAFKDYVGKGICHLEPFPDTHTGSSTVTYAEDLAHASPAYWGTTARWRNDDDRSFALRDSVDMRVKVSGSGGIDFDILVIKIVVGVSLDVASWVDTVVREDLSSVQRSASSVLPGPVAGSDGEFLQSNVHVTPVGTNQIGVNPLTISLDISLGPLPIIGTIKWAPVIFNAGDVLKIISNPAIAPEQDRLRVGELSELRSTLPGTPLTSHFPQLGGGGAFASMPETVSQCLAEEKAGGHAPTPKQPTPAPPAPPYGLCWYAFDTDLLDLYHAQSLPLAKDTFSYQPAGLVQPVEPDVCATIGQPGGWDQHFTLPEQRDCIDFTLQYLCGHLNGTDNTKYSRVVTVDGETQLAHLITTGKQEDELSAKMWSKCATAFATLDPALGNNPSAAYFLGQLFVHDFVQVGMCDQNTLVPVDGVPGHDPDSDCTPDPQTHQCWSFTPCFVDPATGLCGPTCSSPLTGCPSPPPPGCDPQTGAGCTCDPNGGNCT